MQRFELTVKEEEIEKALIKERDRISRIIHDEIGNKQIALLYEIDRIYKQDAPDLVGTEMLQQITVQLKESIRDTRALVRQFSDFRLNSNSIDAELELFCKSKDSLFGVSVGFAGRHSARRFDFQKEKEIVAMVKELVYNSFKYSSCWHIDIALTWTDQQLFVEVSDDGYGLKEKDIKQHKSTGLSGMAARCTAIGAMLKVEKPVRGARISITLPL